MLPFAPTWLRVDRTEMKSHISSLGQFEQTAWYPKQPLRLQHSFIMESEMRVSHSGQVSIHMLMCF